MNFDFRNKIVLITGGGSGIGRSTAHAFSKAGAQVVLAGRSEQESMETIALMGGEKAGSFIKADVTCFEDMKAAVQYVIDTYGRLDIAFNNAGVQPVNALLADVDPNDWERVLSVDLTGVFHSMKAEIPVMIAQGGGVIVNNASTSGVRGVASMAVYSAGKHAVVGLTKSAALEYAKAGLRINAVLPGPVDTPPVRLAEKNNPGTIEKAEKTIPLGRMAKPEEIADAVLFLSSEKSTFITGHSLVIDGGMTIK